MATWPDMLVARYALESLTMPVVRLRDPRSGRDDSFAFQWHLEQALYGGATGGLYRLLQRASLSGCTLTLSKASVSAGAVTAEQLRELIALLSESLPLESQARPRTTPARPRTTSHPPFPIAARGWRSSAHTSHPRARLHRAAFAKWHY